MLLWKNTALKAYGLLKERDGRIKMLEQEGGLRARARCEEDEGLLAGEAVGGAGE